MRHRTLIVGGLALAAGIAGTLLALEASGPYPPTQPHGADGHMHAAPPHTDSPAGKIRDAVPDRSYVFVAEATGTVETLMQEKRADGSLAFTSKEYPTLGSFLESVNGVRNENGEYWMLHINGTRSSVGMSSAPVVPGDRIEWRYE